MFLIHRHIIPCYDLYWGRKDCPTTPETSVIQEFPNARMNSSKNFDYFKRVFNFNEKEVRDLAILWNLIKTGQKLKVL